MTTVREIRIGEVCSTDRYRPQQTELPATIETRKILGCHVVGERTVDIAQLAGVAIAAGMDDGDDEDDSVDEEVERIERRREYWRQRFDKEW